MGVGAVSRKEGLTEQNVTMAPAAAPAELGVQLPWTASSGDGIAPRDSAHHCPPLGAGRIRSPFFPVLDTATGLTGFPIRSSYLICVVLTAWPGRYRSNSGCFEPPVSGGFHESRVTHPPPSKHDTQSRAPWQRPALSLGLLWSLRLPEVNLGTKSFKQENSKPMGISLHLENNEAFLLWGEKHTSRERKGHKPRFSRLDHLSFPAAPFLSSIYGIREFALLFLP